MRSPPVSDNGQSERRLGHWNFNKSTGVFAEWMKNDKIKVDGDLIGVDFRF